MTLHRMVPIVVALFVLTLLALPAGLAAQEMQNLPQGQLAGQSLRPYWHVFIAYAIAIVAVLGWVVSIARRLAALESRLGDG